MALISRNALYERIWTQPLKSVAAEFGISDVGLRKLCTKADIPVPERGYWAKARAGKPPQRIDLPLRAPAMPNEVTIGESPYRYHWLSDPKDVLAEPIPARPVFEEPIEAVEARVAHRIGKVPFERNLAEGHALIRNLLAEDAKRRPSRGDPSWRVSYETPLFDSGFERHRLRIINSLFLGVQRAGATPWLRGETARDLGIQVGVETVAFTYDHPQARSDSKGRWATRPGTIDTLCLTIQGAGARTWMDTEADRLEARLDEVVVHLIVAGELNYRADCVARHENTLRRRREAEEQLAKAQAEARRKAREARIAAEQARRSELIETAAALRAADEIRTLIARVVSENSATGSSGAIEWSRWALAVADRLDPVQRLRFDETGRAWVIEPDWPDPDELAIAPRAAASPDHTAPPQPEEPPCRTTTASTPSEDFSSST